MDSTKRKAQKTKFLPATLTALKILQILKESSDQDHPIAQVAIAEKLDVDRKTIARCLEVMEGYMDYEIAHQKKGVYLIPDDDSFELSEVRLLIDSVLASKVISAEQTDIIVKKLSKLLNKYDRTHIRHIHSYKDWSKVDNINIFWTIEVFDDAINKNVQVSFDYNMVGIDKKLHIIGRYTASPVQLAFSSGQYFLLAYTDEDDEIRSFRIDKITNAKILDNVSKKANKELDWRDIASVYVEGHPYMSFGKTEHIRLRILQDEIGRVFDVFGTNVRISSCGDDNEKHAGMVEVAFYANTEDVYRFMVQNADVAEIMEPHSIRARILKFGRNMHIRYLSSEEDWALANYESAISDKWQMQRSEWMLEASDRAVRSLIEKYGTSDKVWGINVDAYDEKTISEIKEYSNLQILKFEGKMPETIDLSLTEAFTELYRVVLEQRSRKEATVRVKNLFSLNRCKKITQLHFFNVEFSEEIDLSGMEKLRLLNLRHCRIKDLEFVKKIPTLMRLEVSGKFVDDISGIYGHRGLRVLTVDDEFIHKFDIDTLRKENPRLRIEVRSQCIPMSESPAVNHPISDIKAD